MLTYPHFGCIIYFKEVIKTFDDRLKKLRIARGLSQAQVAKDLGIPQKTYCNYERNEREPNSTFLIKIGAYFGVTLDYLLNYYCDTKESPPPVNKWEALESSLEALNDAELNEMEKYAEFLLWKRKRNSRQNGQE